MTWIWLMLLVVMVRVNHVSAIEHCLLLNILYVECACSLCWAYFHYSKAPGKYGIYFKTIMFIHTSIFSEKLLTLQKPELNEPCFHLIWGWVLVAADWAGCSKYPSPLQCFLAPPGGSLCIPRHDDMWSFQEWKTSSGRDPGIISCRCLNHLKQPLLMQSNNGPLLPGCLHPSAELNSSTASACLYWLWFHRRDHAIFMR